MNGGSKGSYQKKKLLVFSSFSPRVVKLTWTMETRRMCPHCRAFITNKDRICPYCNESVGARAIDRRMPGEILGGIIPQNRFVTMIILLINSGLYAAMAVYSMGQSEGGGFM